MVCGIKNPKLSEKWSNDLRLKKFRREMGEERVNSKNFEMRTSLGLVVCTYEGRGEGKLREEGGSGQRR